MEIEEQDRIQEAQFSKHRQQQQAAQNPPNHRRHDHASSSSSSSSSSSALEDQVKLVAISISFNARLKAADMPVSMQEHALRVARSVSDSAPGRTPNSSLLARVLKKEFDSEYGPAWHCVVGKSFGSFVTHSPGGFLYFSLDDSLVSVLLFKTEVRLVAQEP